MVISEVNRGLMGSEQYELKYFISY